MNTKNVIGLLAGLVLAWGNVQAQTAGPKQPFSAQAVQQVPGQSPKTANMYVDPHHVRMEYRMGGRKVIEIVDLDHQRALTAFPELGVYVEMQAPQNVIRQATQNAGMQSPCDLVPQATCKYLGQERLFGRVTDKWQMTYQREGKTLQALYWIDRARRMPLRQVFPGGTTTEMKPAGMDTINGRRVEKWVLTTTRPDGQVMTSQQWFDPQLGIAIRETMQGGYLRELRNIRVGPQDPSLFALPPGLRKIDMAQLQQLLRGQTGGSRQGMPATPQGRPTAPPPQAYPPAGGTPGYPARPGGAGGYPGGYPNRY